MHRICSSCLPPRFSARAGPSPGGPTTPTAAVRSGAPRRHTWDSPHLQYRGGGHDGTPCGGGGDAGDATAGTASQEASRCRQFSTPQFRDPVQVQEPGPGQDLGQEP